MNFQERFKGKTSLIDKYGITGVVAREGLPINKPDFLQDQQNFLQLNSTHDATSNQSPNKIEYFNQGKGIKLLRKLNVQSQNENSNSQAGLEPGPILIRNYQSNQIQRSESYNAYTSVNNDLIQQSQQQQFGGYQKQLNLHSQSLDMNAMKNVNISKKNQQIQGLKNLNSLDQLIFVQQQNDRFKNNIQSARVSQSNQGGKIRTNSVDIYDTQSQQNYKFNAKINLNYQQYKNQLQNMQENVPQSWRANPMLSKEELKQQIKIKFKQNNNGSNNNKDNNSNSNKVPLNQVNSDLSPNKNNNSINVLQSQEIFINHNIINSKPQSQQVHSSASYSGSNLPIRFQRQKFSYNEDSPLKQSGLMVLNNLNGNNYNEKNNNNNGIIRKNLAMINNEQQQ